jgi:aldehyde:ferredoxin oxidoreductase
MNIKGYAGKIVKIDLTNKTVEKYPFSEEEYRLFAGGKILAAKILYDNILEKIDPYSPENMVVISTGPFTAHGVPCSSRFNISTISPLTGICVSSNCGGDFGMKMKGAGYDAVVIIGKAEKPTYIKIHGADITFESAEHLWGQMTTHAEHALMEETGAKAALVIGPAGENLVRYAGVFNKERTAGRGGVGAVFGSKNLKGMVAFGGAHHGTVFNKEKLQKMTKSWVESLKKHPATGKAMPRLGTAGLVAKMQLKNMLATRNYSSGQWEHFEKVSGETLAEKYLVKNGGCVTCPIKCSRVVMHEGKEIKGPELETLALLSSNILNESMENVIKWNYELDELGMDTISAASTIAFCMELNEKGLFDCGLEFGKTDNISKAIHDIAYRKGKLAILADGSRAVSEKYGGKEFAIHSKGMELAAYEPRGGVGQGLGYAVANRGGCHLNAGYLVFLEGLGLNVNQYTSRGKAAFTVMFQNLMEAVSALGNCLFTTYAVFPAMLIEKPNKFIPRLVNKVFPFTGSAVAFGVKHPKMLSVNIKSLIPYPVVYRHITGIKMNLGSLIQLGKRGYNMERLLNIRFGITEKDDALPARLTDELQISDNPKSHVPLAKLKKKYYKIRQWDKNGIPKIRLAKKLKIEKK